MPAAQATVFVDGEHGTTGLQIHERLKRRDDIRQLHIDHADRRDAGVRERLLREADFAILCLPDDASREAAGMVEGHGTRLIDASTAHRTDPDWTFGFAELTADHAERIAGSHRVSNPGCYPTGAIALLRPLTERGVLARDRAITINAVSGYTGGGKSLIAEMEGDGAPPHFLYATGLAHKHVPEITRHALLERRPIFAPSVGRFAQGMIVQVPLFLDGFTRETLHEALSDHYARAEYVEVAPLDNVARVDPTALNGTNRIRLHVFGNDDQALLVAVLDNLGKGASGACVQALDLMLGAEGQDGESPLSGTPAEAPCPSPHTACHPRACP